MKKTWVSSVGATFASVDWFVPPYMQGGAIRKLALAIDAAPETAKHSVLEAGLRRLYEPEYQAVMLLERYRKLEPVSSFAIQVREAMEAAAFGLNHAAIAMMLTVLEGIVRKLADADGRDVGPGTKKLVAEIEQLAKEERHAATAGSVDDALLERIEMVEQLRDFMRDRLLIGTSKYDGIGHLNRHGILHGLFLGYGAESNFHKLISFLDGLVFFISLRRTGISCFAPEDTTDSTALAAYFRALVAARQARSNLHLVPTEKESV